MSFGRSWVITWFRGQQKTAQLGLGALIDALNRKFLERHPENLRFMEVKYSALQRAIRLTQRFRCIFKS